MSSTLVASTSGVNTVVLERPEPEPVPSKPLTLILKRKKTKEPRSILARHPSPHRTSDERVRWRDDVVDNENMNLKKSKKCCIFHKQRNFGESDSDDSEDDDEHQHTDKCNGADKQHNAAPQPATPTV